MTSEPHDMNYYVEKARQCFLLADLCHDPRLAVKVREIGNEFLVEAMELGANAGAFPPNWHRQQRNLC